MAIKTITPAEVFRLQQESGSISIIDVREGDEFEEVSSPLATNYPLSTLDVDAFAKGRDRRESLYVICRSGRRSLSAAQMFAEHGFGCVYNVEGGMLEWEKSGLPVVRK